MSKPPRRILYVHNTADLYGASRSLARLVGRLDRRRFEPIVVLPQDGPLRPLLEQTDAEVQIRRGLPVIDRSLVRSWRLLLFPLQFLRSTLALRAMIRDHGIDLVHTNTGVIPSPALAARLAGVPHFWHIRDWFQEFRQLWRPYASYICRHSIRVLAISEAVAGQFRDRRRVQVIYNGLDLSEFEVPREEYARQFRDRWQLGDDFVVGVVGRIKLVRKGQEVLIQATAHLARRGLRIKCVIVGAPFPGNEHHLETLRRMVDELNLRDQVIFTGEVSDARTVYPALNVFVLPSVQPEPFGGVVVEAMAMGVPVIATGIGGPIDQITDGETGFLVPPGDPIALAGRIEELMRDTPLRLRMARAGPEHVARCFSLDRTVAQLESLYAAALDPSTGA